jgi:cell division protease FtsH
MMDEEVRRILEDAHQTAKKLLEENRLRLVHLADKLLAKETLEGPELEAAFTEPLTEEKTEDSVR